VTVSRGKSKDHIIGAYDASSGMVPMRLPSCSQVVGRQRSLACPAMPTTFVEFDDAALDEMRGVNATIEDLLRSTPPISAVDPAETRKARAEGHSAFGPVPVLERGRDLTIAGPAGDISLRIFVPEDR